MTNEQLCKIKKSLLKCAVEVETILELKQQVEKMKCCENCKYRPKLQEMKILDLDREPCNICKNCKYRLKLQEMKILDLDRKPCNICDNHSKWEIYE